MSLHLLAAIRPRPRERALAAALALVAAILIGGSAGAEYREAPMLMERVDRGELPPVEERLPETPLVVTPLDSIGVYGGEWRTGLGGGIASWHLRTVGYDHLVNWAPDWSGVVPNIAESYSVNPDATVYTIKLRKGMHWSDGAPFDADDLMFAYEHVFKNEKLDAAPAHMQTEGGDGVAVKIDDVTVEITFPVPNALFLENIARITTLVTEDAFLRYPAHYMKQFHEDFNKEDLDQRVAKAGVKDWTELFTLRSDTWLNPDKPTLNAWQVTQPMNEGSQMTTERNPYYFKVDPEGNQLPYLDRVTFEVVQNPEVLLLKALAGELDMHADQINTPENKAVLFDNMERGGYHFFDLLPADSNKAGYMLNLTHPDPVKREIFNNKKFRIALSHGINRQEIIDVVYIGQHTPAQVAILPAYTPLYNEQLATQYLEYDPDLANRLLDEAGFAERDSAGMRLGPDGKPISFAIMVRADRKSIIDVSEMVARNWKALGIDVRLDVVERALIRERAAANQHDAVVEDFSGGKWEAFLQPMQYLPNHPNSFFGYPWLLWWQKNPAGEEPPEHVKKQLQLWDTIRQTADPDRRIEIMRELLVISADSFYVIGTSVPMSGYGIVNNRMRNVPEVMEGAYFFAAPGPLSPSTFYYEDGRRK